MLTMFEDAAERPSAVRTGPSYPMRKVLLAAVAATSAILLGSSASAANVHIVADQLATSSYTTQLGGTVDGNPFSLNVYESPDYLTVSVDGGPQQTLLVFCVDIFHYFDGGTPPVDYVTGILTRNSDNAVSGAGTLLSNVISGEIGYLATLGLLTNDAERLSGIQGAIWKTEYAGLTLSGGSSYVDYYAGLAAAWGAGHPNATFAPAIYSVTGNTQGFVYGDISFGHNDGGVPEPASWALMIAGFGMAGAVLRRRRGALAGV